MNILAWRGVDDDGQNTVWPESNKLLGHNNEIVCVCANAKGTLLASVCKVRPRAISSVRRSHALSVAILVVWAVAVQARDVRDAHVFLWDTTTMRPVQRLDGHTLTVLQLEFSPDDRYCVRPRFGCRFLCCRCRRDCGAVHSALLGAPSLKGGDAHAVLRQVLTDRVQGSQLLCVRAGRKRHVRPVGDREGSPSHHLERFLGQRQHVFCHWYGASRRSFAVSFLSPFSCVENVGSYRLCLIFIRCAATLWVQGLVTKP